MFGLEVRGTEPATGRRALSRRVRTEPNARAWTAAVRRTAATPPRLSASNHSFVGALVSCAKERDGWSGVVGDGKQPQVASLEESRDVRTGCDHNASRGATLDAEASELGCEVARDGHRNALSFECDRECRKHVDPARCGVRNEADRLVAGGQRTKQRRHVARGWCAGLWLQWQFCGERGCDEGSRRDADDG